GEGIEPEAFRWALEGGSFQPGQQEIEQIGGDQEGDVGPQAQPNALGQLIPAAIGLAIAGPQYQNLAKQQAADQAQVVSQAVPIPPAQGWQFHLVLATSEKPARELQEAVSLSHRGF